MDVPENEKMTNDTQGHNNHTEQVETLAAVLERSEEARTYLQTDRVDKEDQAKFLEEVEQMLVKVEREMSKDKTDEQNPSQAQGNTFYSELT